MSDAPQPPDPPDPRGVAGEPAPERRRLLDDLDLLPETTSDESGGHGSRSDEDYRADRPPHHGD